jgi:hypothetical protein
LNNCRSVFTFSVFSGWGGGGWVCMAKGSGYTTVHLRNICLVFLYCPLGALQFSFHNFSQQMHRSVI